MPRERYQQAGIRERQSGGMERSTFCPPSP
jgi:hypothetical protein